MNLPATQEIQIRSLGLEHPLEEKMPTHSSILPWTIPWTKEPGSLISPCCCKESDTSEQLTHTHCRPTCWSCGASCVKGGPCNKEGRACGHQASDNLMEGKVGVTFLFLEPWFLPRARLGPGHILGISPRRFDSVRGGETVPP